MTPSASLQRIVLAAIIPTMLLAIATLMTAFTLIDGKTPHIDHNDPYIMRGLPNAVALTTGIDN